MSAGQVVRQVLAHRWLPAGLAVVAIAVTWPSVGQGLVADDLLHRTLFLNTSLSRAVEDMFVFADPSRNREWMDLGVMPWWTAEGLRIAFFRPLAVLTHWIDYSLWPESAASMHVHNVLWYAAACLAAAAVYRRLIKFTWVAGLAALLFTVDTVHLGSVAWVANRNVLMSILFGLLCLRSHDQWRREGKAVAGAVACLWLAASVFSAEAGASMGAYLTAYAVFLDRGPWRGRLISLLPYVAVGLSWQIVYRFLGYGIQGSGFYVEPASEPLQFVGGVLERGPILLLGQVLGVLPFGYNFLSESVSRTVWLTASALVVLGGALLAPLIRAHATARFWAAGMVLSVVPACAIRLLSGRLLVFAGLGAMGLIAAFVAGYFQRAAWVPQRPAGRVATGVFCYLLLILHLVLPPIAVPLLAAIPQNMQDTVQRVTDIGPLASGPDQHVIVVNAPSPFHFLYLPDLRRLQDEPTPGHIRILAEAYGPVKVEREDDRTILVRPALGFVPPVGAGGRNRQAAPAIHVVHMYQHLGTFWRNPRRPSKPSDRVELTGVSIEISALTDDGRPGEVRIQFDRPLEHPLLTWLWWDWDGERFRDFRLPAVGEQVTLPGPSMR